MRLVRSFAIFAAMLILHPAGFGSSNANTVNIKPGLPSAAALNTDWPALKYPVVAGQNCVTPV